MKDFTRVSIEGSVEHKRNAKKRNSPGNSLQRSRLKNSEQGGSQERLTRNDSAQTPYFLTTPQRTDSNWGGSVAYQNMGSSSIAATKKVQEAV